VRFLGIDYGTRRVGLAYGDELGVATPLPALTDAEPAKRWAGLAEVIHRRRVTELVLGYPLNMNGSAGFKAKEVEAFAARLRKEFGLPVHLVDERLTSHLAEAGMNQRELRDIRGTGIVDSRSAAIILQDYLDQRFPPPPPGAELP
jgi:putative Holliday junction resolvase